MSGPITTALSLLADRGATPSELIEACARMEDAMPKWLVASDDKPKRRSRIPDGFPDEAAKDVACRYWREQGCGQLCQRVGVESEKFAAHHKSKGTLAVDWMATWRTWYVNAAGFAKKDGGSTPVEAASAPARQFVDERSDEGVRALITEWQATGKWKGRVYAHPPDHPKTRIPDRFLKEFGITAQTGLFE